MAKGVVVNVGISEFAGNLKMELLNVREDRRVGVISDGEAYRRVLALRRRRLSGDFGLLRRPVEAGVLQQPRN